jgi:hypothetical protein
MIPSGKDQMKFMDARATWPRVSEREIIDVPNAFPHKKAVVFHVMNEGRDFRVYVLDYKNDVSIETVLWDGFKWVMTKDDGSFGGPSVLDKGIIKYVRQRIEDACYKDFIESLRRNPPTLGI